MLPALLPSDGWSKLDITGGMDAVIEYERAINESDAAVRESIFDALRAYCEKDTLAMVQLREALLT